MITFLIIWWLVGFLSFLKACWNIEAAITVKDLLMSTLAGICGLYCLIFLIMFPNKRKPSFLDKRIF